MRFSPVPPLSCESFGLGSPGVTVCHDLSVGSRSKGSEARSGYLPETFLLMFTLKPTEDGAAAITKPMPNFESRGYVRSGGGKGGSRELWGKAVRPIRPSDTQQGAGERTQEAEGRRWTRKHETAGWERRRRAQAQPGGRGWRMRSRPHRSTPNAAGRTAGASRAAAAARSGRGDHSPVGGRWRGRRGRSLSQPEIFGRSSRLQVIILKVGLLRNLLVNLFQVERRGDRAGRLGRRSIGRAARCCRRGSRFFPGRQLRSRVFRGLIRKIDPLVFCVNSSRLGG